MDKDGVMQVPEEVCSYYKWIYTNCNEFYEFLAKKLLKLFLLYIRSFRKYVCLKDKGEG